MADRPSSAERFWSKVDRTATCADRPQPALDATKDLLVRWLELRLTDEAEWGALWAETANLLYPVESERRARLAEEAHQ